VQGVAVGVAEGLPLPEPFKFQVFATDSGGDGKKETRDASLAEDEALYAEAVGLYRKGLYSKAVDKFRAYIDQFAGNPRSKASFYWIAECYTQMKDTKKADDAFLQGATSQLHQEFDITHVTLQVMKEAFTRACSAP